MLASSVDGFEIAVTLPMSEDAETGDFAPCPACLDIIDSGGEVRGLILQDGKMAAAVAGNPPLPGEEDLWEKQPYKPFEGPVYQPPTEPMIFFDYIQGSVSEESTLLGLNFSPGYSCYPIQVLIDGQTLTDTLEADDDGRFTFAFTPGYPLAYRKVEARQECPMETNYATTWLLVRHGDEPEKMEIEHLIYLPVINKKK